MHVIITFILTIIFLIIHVHGNSLIRSDCENLCKPESGYETSCLKYCSGYNSQPEYSPGSDAKASPPKSPPRDTDRNTQGSASSFQWAIIPLVAVLVVAAIVAGVVYRFRERLCRGSQQTDHIRHCRLLPHPVSPTDDSSGPFGIGPVENKRLNPPNGVS